MAPLDRPIMCSSDLTINQYLVSAKSRIEATRSTHHAGTRSRLRPLINKLLGEKRGHNSQYMASVDRFDQSEINIVGYSQL